VRQNNILPKLLNYPYLIFFQTFFLYNFKDIFVKITIKIHFIHLISNFKNPLSHLSLFIITTIYENNIIPKLLNYPYLIFFQTFFLYNFKVIFVKITVKIHFIHFISNFKNPLSHLSLINIINFSLSSFFIYNNKLFSLIFIYLIINFFSHISFLILTFLSQYHCPLLSFSYQLSSFSFSLIIFNFIFSTNFQFGFTNKFCFFRGN